MKKQIATCCAIEDKRQHAFTNINLKIVTAENVIEMLNASLTSLGGKSKKWIWKCFWKL